MASGEQIRRALMALMGAKGNNIAARGAGQPIAIMDDVGRQIDEINPVETPGALRDARANARQVQGVDPLATSNREFQGSEASGAFPDQPVKRTMTGPAGRLPHESDEVPGIRKAENLAEDATNGGGQFGPPDDTFRAIIRDGDGLNDPRLEAYMAANPKRGRELVNALMDQFERGGFISNDDIPF